MNIEKIVKAAVNYNSARTKLKTCPESLHAEYLKSVSDKMCDLDEALRSYVIDIVRTVYSEPSQKPITKKEPDPVVNPAISSKIKKQPEPNIKDIFGGEDA